MQLIKFFKINQTGINKTNYKKTNRRVCAVDLVDILKSVPDINITQSLQIKPYINVYATRYWLEPYIGNDQWNSN